MLSKAHEEIHEKFTENRNKMSQLRNKLTNELHEFCVERGGHFFYGWADDSWTDVTGDLQARESRGCTACRKFEYRTPDIKEEEE